jgi:hypothetical protein
MAWTVGQYQKAWSLIPELSTDDVAGALCRARKKLPADQQEILRQRLGVAFHTYIAEKLFELGVADVKPSARTKQLERIAKQAERLRKMMPDDGNAVTLAASQEMRRALMLTPCVRQTLVLPPTDPAGFAALQAINQVVALLELASKRAFERERLLIQRANKRKGKAHHKGDTAMRTLIGTINGIWVDVFKDLPGVTPSETRDEGGGSYLPFVHTLLRAYARRVPDELESLAPLRAPLRLTQQAIRSHFRATGISRLRRMA